MCSSITFETEQASSSTKTIKILRLLRLGKLLRLARIKRILDRYAEELEDMYQWLSVVKVLGILLSLAHVAACGWCVIVPFCLPAFRPTVRSSQFSHACRCDI
jgi:hypothetical protein